MLGPKNVWSKKKCWVPKILGLKKNFGPKKFWVWKKCRVWINVGSEKIHVTKKFWSLKKFSVRTKIWGQKNEVVFHQRSFSFEGDLPSTVVIHQMSWWVGKLILVFSWSLNGANIKLDLKWLGYGEKAI